MLTMFAVILAMQQSPGGVVWETPAAEPAPVAQPADPVPDLPDWAVSDPFAWERSQCSPLVRGRETIETCQTRVRGDLAAVLGDRLPAGLRPSDTLTPCQATPDADGSFPVECRQPERRVVDANPIQDQICESRPRREGGAVAFVTECRPAGAPADRNGLSIRIPVGD